MTHAVLNSSVLEQSDPQAEPVIPPTVPASADALRRLTADAGWVQHLKDALAPYRIDAQTGNQGIFLTGDRPAVLIAQRALSNVTEKSDTRLQETLPAVIDEALKRDLALRLEGLMRPIKAMSLAQLSFIEDLLDAHKSFIFGLGPTGTGKTYLPVVAGLSLLASDAIKHFVITRPHEMLEGEVITAEARAETQRDEQFETYFDILNDLVGVGEVEQLIANRKIEVLPLGAMRGRTFKNALILVDEAHNMSIRKMRMAVTRLGENSRIAITGDPSQSELPNGERSGLSHLLEMLKGTDIACTHYFETSGIVRNPIVAQIEALYSKMHSGS